MDVEFILVGPGDGLCCVEVVWVRGVGVVWEWW